MKKLVTLMCLVLALSARAQKQDSVLSVVILMDTAQFKQTIELIDKNVDSKSVSSWLITLLTRGAQLVKMPAKNP